MKKTFKTEDTSKGGKILHNVYGQEATNTKPRGVTPKPVCSRKAESQPGPARPMFKLPTCKDFSRKMGPQTKSQQRDFHTPPQRQTST